MDNWEEVSPDTLDSQPQPAKKFLIAGAVATICICLVLIGYQWVRLRQVEDAVRALSMQEQTRVQELVQALLSGVQEDATSGKMTRAIRAAETATALLATARRGKYPALSGYFFGVLKTLDRVTATEEKPELAEALHRSRIALAEYRSALETSPALPRERHLMQEPFPLSARAWMDFSRVIRSPFIDGAVLKPGADFVVAPASRRLGDDVWIVGINFLGAAQTLDGVHWRDVKFINSHIRYTGGEVELQDVVFINCTFEFPRSPRGKQLANYAALRAVSLLIS